MILRIQSFLAWLVITSLVRIEASERVQDEVDCDRILQILQSPSGYLLM